MSKREYGRFKKIARERKVRALARRHAELWRAKHYEPVFEKLEEPVFWGYSRHFELRPDVAYRRDASKWRAILALIQNVQESRRKDFRYRRWPSRRWHTWPHEPKTFGAREFQSKVPGKYHRYFHWHYIEGKKTYFFRFEWMLVSKRRKVFHTHRRVVDQALEQELGYLDTVFEQNRYWDTWSHLKRGYAGWKNWNWTPTKDSLRDQYHRAQIDEALYDHWRGDMITFDYHPNED